jgi:L-fuconolactonase
VTSRPPAPAGPGASPPGPPKGNVVDAHQHLWDLSVRPQPFLDQPGLEPLRRKFGPADLAAVAGPAGVTATIVVQTVTEPGETPELLAVAASGGLVSAAVGWVDLTAPDVADAIGLLREQPGAGFLAGIRHPVLIEPDPGWLARPEVIRGLAAVAAAGLAYDVVAHPRQLPAAVAAAAALPQLTFVLDHLGNPDLTWHVDGFWARQVRDLGALPNTVCKLSGILGEPAPPYGVAGPVERDDPAGVAHLRPYYQIALDSFGPDRMMFGSDWPVCTLTAAYGDVLAAARSLTADLAHEEQQAIFAGTAALVYGLPRTDGCSRARRPGR